MDPVIGPSQGRWLRRAPMGQPTPLHWSRAQARRPTTRAMLLRPIERIALATHGSGRELVRSAHPRFQPAGEQLVTGSNFV